MEFMAGIGVLMALVFIYHWYFDFTYWMKRNEEKRWFQAPVLLNLIYMAACVVLPLALVNVLGYGDSAMAGHVEFQYFSSLILSILISFFWFRYLWWVDIYETEGVWLLLLQFALSCVALFLLFPISQILLDIIDFHLNGELINDALFCVFGIGLVEELIKIIPFVIILRWGKGVNEPFDYILYASLSALGFAFMENVLYLSENLESVHGRSLFASVMHMICTSIIAYGWAIKKFTKKKSFWLKSWVLILLAATAHGFYDFWLINPTARSFQFLTFLFLLVAIKVWMVMKNNLLNISPFFKYSIKLRASRFKYRLLNALLTISYLAYLVVFFLEGKNEANDFLLSSVVNYMFVLLFISINFSGFEVIKSYVAPLFPGISPIRYFLPKLVFLNNVSGERLSLTSHSPIHSAEELSKPIRGKLLRRIVLEGDIHWYLFENEDAQDNDPFRAKYLLLRTNSSSINLDSRSVHSVRVRGLRVHPDLNEPAMKKSVTFSLDAMWCKAID